MWGWHEQTFRGADEVEAEENLVEVGDNQSAKIVEDHDSMLAIALTQHVVVKILHSI